MLACDVEDKDKHDKFLADSKKVEDAEKVDNTR